MKDPDLTNIDFSVEEQKTLSANHLESFQKNIPASVSFPELELINTKYNSVIPMALKSHKPISKMELES